MSMPCRSAVRNHRNRQRGGMGRIVADFNIEHGGQAAKALLEVRRDLKDVATVQHFSALTRLGEDEARQKLMEYLRPSDE